MLIVIVVITIRAINRFAFMKRIRMGDSRALLVFMRLVKGGTSLVARSTLVLRAALGLLDCDATRGAPRRWLLREAVPFHAHGRFAIRSHPLNVVRCSPIGSGR